MNTFADLSDLKIQYSTSTPLNCIESSFSILGITNAVLENLSTLEGDAVVKLLRYDIVYNDLSCFL